MENSIRPSSDLAEFRKLAAAAERVVVLTGAGVSAESGVPTFRGAGGFWRTYQVGLLTKGWQVFFVGSRPCNSWSFLQGPFPSLGVLPLQEGGKIPIPDLCQYFLLLQGNAE